MEKQSRISNCRFTSVWTNPKGGIIHYHELTMQNGDIGTIGTVDKLPKKIEIGTEITYEISEDKKIKLVQSTYIPPKPTYTPPQQNKMTSYSKKPDDFIGYVLGYAKDIVCAKITAKIKIEDEAKEICKISDELFIQVKKMLADS